MFVNDPPEDETSKPEPSEDETSKPDPSEPEPSEPEPSEPELVGPDDLNSVTDEERQVKIQTNAIASILEELILQREREYDELVAAGLNVPRNQRSNPTMLTPGFTRDGKLKFLFD